MMTMPNMMPGYPGQLPGGMQPQFSAQPQPYRQPQPTAMNGGPPSFGQPAPRENLQPPTEPKVSPISVPLNPVGSKKELPRYAAIDRPAPIIRFQSHDEPIAKELTLLMLPSPEKLGVLTEAPPTSVAVDWNDLHARLQKLGVISFQLNKTAQNSYRVNLLLGSRTAPPRRIETEGRSEADAALAALRQAESGAQ